MPAYKSSGPVQEMPVHIGIIMDGNGRWAQRRGLPRSVGHRQGSKTLRNIVRYAQKIGIHYVTVYAFSTENWKRPKEEVDGIMDMFREYLRSTDDDEGVRLCFLGDRTPLAPDIRRLMQDMEERTTHNTGIVLNIAINYGGRDELVHAVRMTALEVQSGKLSPNDITEESIQKHLYTAGQPDPDVIIRPSGEMRLSNFLLWQSAYAELIFMDVLWPDFKPRHLDMALKQYWDRDRRFGGVS